MRRFASLCFLAVSVGLSMSLLPLAAVWGEDATTAIHCQPPAPMASQLDCTYRFLESDEIRKATAAVDGASLAIAADIHAYPEPGQHTALFFLVDTSDPARQAVVRQNAETILALLSHKAPHLRVGIGIFDSALTVLAPIGSDDATLTAAAKKIKATGLATEFYRSIRDAALLLTADHADRKGLVVFSDGLAEDKAYTHEDVMKVAREGNVVIYGLGYPASHAEIPALQRLRRLAEESRGPFAEADVSTHQLPAAFLGQFYAYLDNGGRFRFPLGTLHGRHELTITAHTASGKDWTLHASVVLPEIALSPLSSPSAWYNSIPLPYWMLGGTLVLLLVAGIVVWFAKRRRSPEKPVAHDTLETPLAYLDIMSSFMEPFTITKPILRIGRHRSNDLCLPDNDSVSSFHAELHCNRVGQFIITDLQSTNGIKINGNKTSYHILEDRDTIELGEISLRFRTISAVGYDFDPGTV